MSKIAFLWDNLETSDDFLKPRCVVSNVADSVGRACKDFKIEGCAGAQEVAVGKGEFARSFENGVLKATTDNAPLGRGGWISLLEELF